MVNEERLTCSGCGVGICGRQAVISRVLGGKGSRRCLACLGGGLGAAPEQLCELVGNYLARRECYRREWLAAAPCDRDGQAPCCPSCLENSPDPPAWLRPELFALAESDDLPEPDLTVDAEESGCGDLMVLMMRSIRKLAPGDVLELIARDPGAAADIPSWCRLTGHALLAGPTGVEGATYYIRKARATSPPNPLP
jgi:tRNA 2-thiouridine synthesizing protein A